MGVEELKMLKSAGLARYHHNLETSRRFFPEICSTHTYDQKLDTVRAAKEAGLSVCSGGIFGLGETWEDRIEMALMLPHRQIRICGGRLQTLGPMHSMVFLAGADGLLTGNCLTVAGSSPKDDRLLAEAHGLTLQGI
jgi:biotin synthase